MAVLPGVLGSISWPSMGGAGLNGLKAGTGARPTGVRAPAVARWRAHLHSLATLIHETSGLGDLDGAGYGWGSRTCRSFLLETGNFHVS
jgi:hypothetical protein